MATPENLLEPPYDKEALGAHLKSLVTEGQSENALQIIRQLPPDLRNELLPPLIAILKAVKAKEEEAKKPQVAPVKVAPAQEEEVDPFGEDGGSGSSESTSTFSSSSREYNQIEDNESVNQSSYLRLWYAHAGNKDSVPLATLIAIFRKSELPKNTLKSIWDYVGFGSRKYIDKFSFCKAMSLISLATSTHEPLISFVVNDIFKVPLSERDFQKLSAGSDNAKKSEVFKPLHPVCNVSEIRAGGFFKHTKYQITTPELQSNVFRRYKDFMWLHSHISIIFKSRIFIPPPLEKNTFSSKFDPTFIENRRRGLQYFLTSLSIHPIISRSKPLHIFLTSATENIHEDKTQFPSEFHGHPIPKSLPSTQMQTLDSADKNITNILSFATGTIHVGKLMVDAYTQMAKSHQQFSSLIEESFSSPDSCNWVPKDYIIQSYKLLHSPLEGISTLSLEYSRTLTIQFVEHFNRLLQLTVSLKALFTHRTNLKSGIKSNQQKLSSSQSKLTGLISKGKLGRQIDGLKQTIKDLQDTVSTLNSDLAFHEYALLNELREFSAQQAKILLTGLVFFTHNSEHTTAQLNLLFTQSTAKIDELIKKST